MSEINNGTPPAPEQPQQGTPGPEQAQQQPGNSPETQPQQPSVEALQQQLQQERQQREHYERQYQALQPEYTKARQALAHLAGAQPQQPQPPADPIAPYVQKLTAQGYDEKSARAVAGIAYDMVAPIQQQFQQQMAVATQASQLDYALTSVASQNQTLFNTPGVYDAVRNDALNLVQHNGQIDPVTLRRMAIIHDYEQRQQQPPAQYAPQYQPNPQPQQTMPPQPFANGMFRGAAGYAPQPQATQPMTADQKAAEDWIKQFTQTKKV
jgi:hypothetical protein